MWLGFELAYYDVAVPQISHYTTGTTPGWRQRQISNTVEEKWFHLKSYRFLKDTRDQKTSYENFFFFLENS